LKEKLPQSMRDAINTEPLKKVIDEIGVTNVLKVLKALDDAGFSLVRWEWKKNPDKLPKGSKKGLKKVIELSKKCSKVKGVARHPEKGYLIPAKSLCMMVLSGKVKDEKLKKVFLERIR